MELTQSLRRIRQASILPLSYVPAALRLPGYLGSMCPHRVSSQLPPVLPGRRGLLELTVQNTQKQDSG